MATIEEQLKQQICFTEHARTCEGCRHCAWDSADSIFFCSRNPDIVFEVKAHSACIKWQSKRVRKVPQ